MKKIEFFKVEGDKINRTRRHCPKCGPGVFIAEHKDRFSCGKCGYTEFKSGGKKEQPVPQDKPAEKPKEPIKEEAKESAEKTEEKPVEKKEKQEQTSDKADNKIEEKEENKKE